jgi:hypothetical protein
MRVLLLSIALGLASILSGCVEADLGDAPLLCNPGTPRCPRDYLCVLEQDRSERCVREGSARAASAYSDGGVEIADAE